MGDGISTTHSLLIVAYRSLCYLVGRAILHSIVIFGRICPKEARRSLDFLQGSPSKTSSPISMFSMARDNKAPAPAPATPVEDEKPLPLPRPGTAGTEMLLKTNRRQASERFHKAQRAEKAYRAKKRATAARQDFKDARGHFKESLKHFKEGIKMTVGVVKSVPYIYGEKREMRRADADQKKKLKALEKRKKLEEKLARDADEEGPEDIETTEQQKQS